MYNESEAEINAQHLPIIKDESNHSNLELEKLDYIDPLDKEAKIELAIRHGISQKVYNIDNFNVESIIFKF